MDSNSKKSLISGAGIAALLLAFSVAIFSIKGCTGRGTDVGGTTGSGDIGAALGPETSSLFGAMEMLGVFDVALNGSAVVTPVSASPMVSVSVTKLSAGPALTLSVAIANTTGSGLEGVVLRLGPLDENIVLVNNDGHDSYNFGDIASGESITKDDIKFERAPASFSFRLYITQRKLHAKSGVVAYSASGGAGASLSKGKSLSNDKSSSKDKYLDIIQRVKALSSPHAVVSGGVISQGAHISTKSDSAGNVKMSYLNVDNHDLKYSFWWVDSDLSDGDQSEWRHATVESTGKTGYFSSLALTSLGNPRIAYYSSTNSWGGSTQDLKYAYCNSDCHVDGNWSTVTIDATDDVGGHTSIALDFDGNPRITYYDFTSRDLKYAFCNAGAACNDSANWRIVILDSTGYVGQFTSLALDPNTAMPRVSYYDYSSGDLKFAYCNAGHPNPPDGTGCESPANWTKTTVDSAYDVGAYTSLALDRTTGYARISYYDITSMDLKFAFYDQLVSTNLNSAQTVALPTYCVTMGTCTSCDNYGNCSDYACCTSYYYDVGFDNMAYSPDIIQTTSGAYRLYYTNITPVCISWDTYNACIGYRYTDSGLVYKTTTDTNPPQASSSNMDIYRQYLNTGGVETDTARDPEVFLLPSGAYRVYYSWYNGSYWQLAYKDTTTTDMTPPSGTNLGAQQLLNVGASAFDHALKPEIVLLTSGRYRLYYGYSNGSYSQLAYRDTTDFNPPACTSGAGTCTGTGGTTNLGLLNYMNIGDSAYNSASGPEVVARPGGGYRLYYHVTTGSTSYIAYRDTTDGSPPDSISTNLGDEQWLAVGGSGSSDQAQDPRVILVPSTGKYRLYYSWYNGSYWQVVYRETSDPNPPGASSTCCGWSVLTVDSSGDSGAFSSTGVDAAGNFFVAYYYSGGAYGITGYLKYATCDRGPLCASTSSWEYTTFDTSGDRGWFASTAITASGLAYIGYYDVNTKNLLLGTVRLFMPTAAVDPGANNGRFHSLKVDPNDYPHIGYATYDTANRLNNAMKYAYWDGSMWQKVTIDYGPTDNNDWQPHVSLALNSAGKPRMLYAWNRNLLKYASCDTACNNAANWTKATITGVTGLMPPVAGGLGSLQALWDLGSGEDSPEIFRVPSTGRYRMYYHRYYTVCNAWDSYSVCIGYIYPYGLVYRETTDTNPPAANCSNCGAEYSLGIGGAVSNDQAAYPEVMQLASGQFRLYYSYYNGSYWQLAYRDTLDSDPPAARYNVRYENTNAPITTGGAWWTNYDGSSTAGSYRYTSAGTAYAQLTFTGTGVSWIATMDGNQGTAYVYIDGVYQANVSLYYAGYCASSDSYGCQVWISTLYQQNVWSITGLSYGSHTIKIVFASGPYVNVDAIDVIWAYPNNMGGPTLLSTTNAYAPDVVQISGGYRLYYVYNGVLAYKDPSNANPPDSANMASATQQSLGITASTPEVFQLFAGGPYRLYFSVSSGTYYRDTNNGSPPDASNLVATEYLVDGDSQNVIKLTSGTWRIYYRNYYLIGYDIDNVPYYGYRFAFSDASGGSSTAQSYVGPSLTLDSSDRPRISYWYNNAVEYSYCDSADCSLPAAVWNSATADLVGSYASSATQTSIALDSSGRPRLAYYKAGPGDLGYAYCDSGCTGYFNWVKSTPAAANYSGRYASLSLDTSDRPRIAHEEYTGADFYLDYSYCDSNCGTNSNWLSARNINGAYTWSDAYGTYNAYEKSYNNPLKVDWSNLARLSYMYGSSTLTYGSCRTGCSSTGSWANRSYGTNYVAWTDFDTDSFDTIHSAYYYYGSGLYYEWRWIY